MFEFIDTRLEVNVQESEYKRLLGYPDQYALDGRAKELADWARQWYWENGKPWIYVRQIGALKMENGQLRINGTDFTSKRLYDQLVGAQIDTAMLLAVSAGKECEEMAQRLWLEEKPDEYFFLEVFGSAVVEHLVVTAAGRLCAWADQQEMIALPHYSPGYPGWDISDQQKLLQLIRQERNYDFPEEIQVLNTGMLQPKKSLLAVFGITCRLDIVQRLSNLIPCENCSLPSCQYRRSLYKDSFYQIEDIRQLQFGWNADSKTSSLNRTSLDSQIKYSVNSKALRKWSQERLKLKIWDDGSVEAKFRYEGTTCSNLGLSLQYHYDIRLGSIEEGYKIIDMKCAPASGDMGHTYMCQHIKNADALGALIENEKPLLGRPLHDVFRWERQYSPSSCHCNAASRDYKWGLVMEVLHYALAKYENQSTDDNKQEAI
jgi:hypothetical protein